MDQAVGERGHPFLLNLCTNVQDVVMSFRRARLGIPILKVHVPAALVHIIGDHPGEGGKVAIPRPTGFV